MKMCFISVTAFVMAHGILVVTPKVPLSNNSQRNHLKIILNGRIADKTIQKNCLFFILFPSFSILTFGIEETLHKKLPPYLIERSREFGKIFEMSFHISDR